MRMVEVAGTFEHGRKIESVMKSVTRRVKYASIGIRSGTMQSYSSGIGMIEAADGVLRHMLGVGGYKDYLSLYSSTL